MGGVPRPSPHGGGRAIPWPRYLPPGQVQIGGGVPKGTYPLARSRLRGTPRYLLPPAKVPTPWPDPDGGIPQGTYPLSSQGTYPSPPRSRQGRGHSKVPTPRPRYLPPPPPPRIGQHMEYLIRRSRHAPCVHAGGLSCYSFNFTASQNLCNKTSFLINTFWELPKSTFDQ